MPNDSIIRGQVVRLYPTADQAQRLVQWTGALRWMWNRYLDAIKEQYAADGTFLWRTQLHPLGQSMRAERDWVADVPSNATIQVAADMDRALRKMVSDRKAGRRCGFPKPKKRFVREAGIYCAGPKMRLSTDLRGVRLPKLGEVKARGLRQIDGRVYAARIWRDGDRWMLSIQYECPAPAPLPPTEAVVAIDLGVKRLATIFDGEKFLHVDAPRPLRKAERLLRRRQRRLSKRVKGSSRRRAQARRVAVIHRKVRNRRKETVHQLTHRITATSGVIVVEDLNVKGMARGRLGKSCHDAALGAILRTLAYKAVWRGREVIKVDRFFPSSQACCGCGEIHTEMRSLGRRTLRCNCGNVMDRDENASVNLYWYGQGVRNRGPGASTRGERGVQAYGPVPLVEPRIDAKVHRFGPRQ